MSDEIQRMLSVVENHEVTVAGIGRDVERAQRVHDDATRAADEAERLHTAANAALPSTPSDAQFDEVATLLARAQTRRRHADTNTKPALEALQRDHAAAVERLNGAKRALRREQLRKTTDIAHVAERRRTTVAELAATLLQVRALVEKLSKDSAAYYTDARELATLGGREIDLAVTNTHDLAMWLQLLEALAEADPSTSELLRKNTSRLFWTTSIEPQVHFAYPWPGVEYSSLLSWVSQLIADPAASKAADPEALVEARRRAEAIASHPTLQAARDALFPEAAAEHATRERSNADRIAQHAADYAKHVKLDPRLGVAAGASFDENFGKPNATVRPVRIAARRSKDAG